MTTPTKLKIYPSASGFITNRGLEIEYNSACQRFMVASIGADRKPLDPIYEKLGLVHEDWYAAQLGDNLKEREFVVRVDLSEEVMYSGRVDFITKDGRIHETKASLSKNFLYAQIRKGQYKKSHLAQVVSYMIQLQTQQAVIMAGYYDEDLNLREKRMFDVRVLDSGAITVDGWNTGLTVEHQLAHLMASVKALTTKEIGPRPSNYLEFGNACHFCPLKSLCTKYDFGQVSAEEFPELGKAMINAEPMKLRKTPEPKKRSKKT